MARFRPPPPPRPDLVRSPVGSFGWLEDRLLHEGLLARLGPEGVAVMTLLALAADRKGASFYGRARMAERLDLSIARVDLGLRRLLALELVAFRPWRDGAADGVWQLLPLPGQNPRRATRTPRADQRSPDGPTTLGEEIMRLGLGLGIERHTRA